MSRGLTGGMQTAVAAATVYPAIFASFDFSTGMVYLWSGLGSVSWDGQTWVGLGNFLAMDRVTEDTQVAARSVKFSLSAVPSTAISNAMVADYRGRQCKIWLGCFDSSGVLISDPQQIYGGLMNQMTINDAGDTCTIDMTVESRLIDLQRQRERRYTDADQKFFYPTDTGLKYVAGLQDQTINWGHETPPVTTDAGGSNYGAGPYSGYDRFGLD